MTIDIQSLLGIGMKPDEAETVMQYKNSEDVVRKLRIFRSHVLEDIHIRQQTLDKIDYIINRLKIETTQ